MGFRNLKNFNLALLAKQNWRLIHDPTSVWAWVLKDQYFPHVSFLEAKKGGRAFWAWSSLLESWDLLLKGAHWQIMRGDQTKLWFDRWVPGIPLGHPTPTLGATFDVNQKVSTIINHETREWHLDNICSIIPDGECFSIFVTQVSNLNHHDWLIWPVKLQG